MATPLDVKNLDAAEPFGENADLMSSHDLGIVGLVKRLIDHTASGTVRYAQPDVAKDVLAIESMTVWDGIVVLRKPVT